MANPSFPGDLDQLTVNVVRGLSMDGPHAARSGHQGTAMALAPLAHVLFTRVLRYDASDPQWFDRDRFVLSNGHASILLYSYLHLAGYGLELDDLRAFRQWGSATPGHPEAGHTAGVEVTTGPLGQGFANAVGMAMAERWFRARFGADVCDHHTYVIVGDGCLMEGISHEAASLAGHLRLNRLIAVYDDNNVTIDGLTNLAFSEDTAARFESYGWQVERLGYIGEDLNALEAALLKARNNGDRPTLLVVRTHIATPSPAFTDDPAAHGYVLTDAAISEAKAVMGLPDEPFWVPEQVLQAVREAGSRGHDDRQAWEIRVAARPEDGEADALRAALGATGVEGWHEALPRWEPHTKVATRVASEACLNALAPLVSGIIAGSADLTGNTGTALKGALAQTAEQPEGRQVYFGVREHAMGGVMVGMAHHGGVIPIGGTFFVFSDYMRPALRLAALSRAKAVFVFTHDSIGVGEDGPTHQPVEHLAALRAMPGLAVIRPADANETALAWLEAIHHDGPTALILTRQAVPTLVGSADRPDGVQRGAYVLVEASSDEPDLILLSTGSEVQLCVQAAERLEGEGLAVRVVSMPCWEFFEDQDAGYQEWVLPPDVPVLAVEAASGFGWERWADDVVALDRFGASAPGDTLMEQFGFTADVVVERAFELLEALEEVE